MIGPAPEVAVILAAGEGSRLRPLTLDRPKALLELGGGETLLGRSVRLLVAAGVRELVVATGYRAEAVRRALECAGVPATYCHNEAYARTQNSVSLHLCARAVGGRAFYKLDGDVVYGGEVLARLARAAAPLAVAVDGGRPLGNEEMKVRCEGGGRIVAFGKALDPAAAAGESMGIERVDAVASPLLFDGLAESVRAGRHDLYYEDVYGELIARGLAAQAVEVGDLPWTEVDTPEDLTGARALVASGRLGD